MRHARGRAALLLATLAVLAIVVGTVTTNLSSPLFGFSFKLPHSSPAVPPPAPLPGLLLVTVLRSGAGTEAPVSGASVSVGSGVAGESSQLLTTDALGEAEVRLPPGNYSLEVYTPQFSAFRDVPVLPNATTMATVSANRTETVPAYSDLSDEDGSGYVGPWQQISLAVNSSSAKLILNSTSFFLDAGYPLAYGPGVSITPGGLNVTEVSAVVVSEPAAPSGPGLWWFTVEPSSFIRLTGLVQLAIATYTVSMKVVVVINEPRV